MADFPRSSRGLAEESAPLRPGADGHVALSAAELEALANSMRFEGRILPVDLEIAEYWGRPAARHHKTGYVMDTADGYLATTAAVRGLTLVTRNTRHFAPQRRSPLIPVLNPWSG